MANTATGELAVTLIVQALCEFVETIRDIQVDPEQCHADPDYRAGWIGACERMLDEIREEQSKKG